MPIESRAVCAKSLTPQKSGHQRKTGHLLIQNGPRLMERGQYRESKLGHPQIQIRTEASELGQYPGFGHPARSNYAHVRNLLPSWRDAAASPCPCGARWRSPAPAAPGPLVGVRVGRPRFRVRRRCSA
jgi:hypothetical protein